MMISIADAFASPDKKSARSKEDQDKPSGESGPYQTWEGASPDAPVPKPEEEQKRVSTIDELMDLYKAPSRFSAMM
jgi:hypothetical protein